MFATKHIKLMTQRNIITSRIDTLRTKRVSICKFIEGAKHFDNNTKQYLVPAFMDLEEISCALSRYKTKLEIVDRDLDELKQYEMVAWDQEVMDKSYDI